MGGVAVGGGFKASLTGAQVRDVRWGRAQETYGEDPYLTSRMGVATVLGIQRARDDTRMLSGLAMLKHFVAYDIESNFAVGGTDPQYRLGFTANVTSTDLRQSFLPAFGAAITEAGAGSLMCAYSGLRIDGGEGQPMCSHPILKTELRQRLNFSGYICSDGGALGFMVDEQHAYKDAAHAAAAAINAGVDINSGNTFEPAVLESAINQSLISASQLDPMLRRLFAKRAALGLLDPFGSTPFAKLSVAKDVDNAEHRAVARKLATRGIVLLKNRDHQLPLDKASLKKVAVLGPNADSKGALVGSYAGCIVAAPINNRSQWHVNPDCNLVTPLDGLRTALGSGRVEYEQGVPIASDAAPGAIARAVETAKNADVAVLVLGLRACALDPIYPVRCIILLLALRSSVLGLMEVRCARVHTTALTLARKTRPMTALPSASQACKRSCSEQSPRRPLRLSWWS